MSRICERRGEVKRARKLYEQSIVSVLPEETNRAACAALARLAKRDGDLSRARELWENAVGNSREGYEAYEQLAIYYEHEVRDPRRALTLAREALDQLCRAKPVGTLAAATYGRTKERFEYRLLRLERKASRTLLDTRWTHSQGCGRLCECAGHSHRDPRRSREISSQDG